MTTPTASTVTRPPDAGASRAHVSAGRDWMWIPAEILLVATTVAGVLMFDRIFEDRSYLAPLLFGVLVAHGLLIALRWMGFSGLMSSACSFVGTLAAVVAIHYSDSAIAAVIPTGRTIDQLQLDLQQAGDVFNAIRAPVPAVTGFLVAAAFGLWLAAVLADWAAFRLLAPGQALLPMLAVIVFVSLLGLPERRVQTTATLIICGLLFVLAIRAAQRASQGVWLDLGPGRGYASLMSAGAVVALIAIAAGLIGGPRLPGAEEAPIVELGDRTREEKKPLEVISPMVQLQPRLIDQSETVMFTVESPEPVFWRIAALDEFDGSLWRAQGSFKEADDELDQPYETRAPVDTIDTRFDVIGMGAVWAPAAYQPISFDNLGEIGVNYEPESATLIVDVDDREVSDGLSYAVRSQIPRFTPDLLRRLPNTNSDTVDDRYLALPGDFSPLAAQTARELTEGLDNPYDKGLALQNFFQENFTYDVDVAKGHDIRRTEDFLTIRRGYCEQFSGTFAGMARSIGLPTRVAIGFTQGDVDPTDPGRYIVRGRHAHAWPEVFIAGAGWVAFEPTPGRGAPNAAEYTGVPEAQDTPPPPPDQQDSEPLPEEQLASAAAAPTPTAVAPTPTPVPPEAVEPVTLEPEPGVSLSSLLLPLALIGVLLAWFLGVPALRRLRDRRRLARAAGDTRRLVTLAWSATTDRLEEDRALGPNGSETLLEYAERVERSATVRASSFVELTQLAVAAAYRSDAPTPTEVDRAQTIAAEIDAELDEALTWAERGVRQIDPRDLLRRDPVDARAARLAGGAVTAITE